MITLPVLAVLEDGSQPTTGDPAQPRAQSLSLAIGEDAVVAIKLISTDRQPVDLTGGQLVLTIRRRVSSATPLVVRTAVLHEDADPPDGLADVFLFVADTLSAAAGPYLYDVWFTDADDNRSQVVPPSPLALSDTITHFGDPDTIPPDLEGVLGGRVLSGVGAPSADDGFNRDWYFDIADPEALVLYGPKTLGVWGAGVPIGGGGGGGGAAISTDDPLPAALAADPGASGEVSDAAHVHPYSIAVAGVSDGYMSAAMATQLAGLVSADFGGQINSLASTVAGHTSTLASHAASLSSLAADISDVAGDLTALTGVVSGHTSTLASHASSIATQGGLISALQAIVFTAGAGLLGGGALSPGPVAFAIGAHADNSIVVGTDDIRVAPALQTAISDNTANIAALTGTVGGHTAALAGLAEPKYIVQQAHASVPSAQALEGLATGFAKVTTGTGVLSTQATILGTDLSGFTDTTLPVANSSGQLVPSSLTLASNTLTQSASASAGTVAAQIINSSNTASSAATLTVKTGGATAADPSLILSTTVTDWKLTVDNATNDRLRLYKGATELMRFDPVASFNQTILYTNGTIGVSLSTWAASGNSRVGSALFSIGLSTNNYFNIGPDTSGTAGRGVAGVYFDGTTWQNALSWTHVASVGTGLLRLMENSGNVVIGAAALTTIATDGFLYQVTCPGPPTGVPTAFSGRAPWVLDSVNNKLYVYNSGWQIIGNNTAPTAYTPGAVGRVPYGNVGATALTDSAGLLFDATNVRLGIGVTPTVAFDVTQSASGAAVSALVSNSSNTASSTAKLRASVAGTTAGAVGLYLERVGQNTWGVESTTAGTLNVIGGAQTAISISTSGESTIFAPFTGGGSARRTRITHTAATAGLPVCAIIDTPDAATDLVIRGNGTGTAGRGLYLYAHDGTQWRKGLTVLNRAGLPNITIAEEGGNVAVAGAGSFGTGTGVISLANATVLPSTNPTGGGILYSDAGALKWRGPSGAVTPIGAA